MTTQNLPSDRNRDQQDGVETQTWGTIEYVDGKGAVLKTNGTGTIDEEVTLINTGYGFNIPQDSDAEVTVLSAGSDTNGKYAMPHIPHEMQRPWKENAGGVQNPLDPNKCLEFSPNMTHIRDTLVALCESGILEIQDGGEVIIRGNLRIQGEIQAGGNISTPGTVFGAVGPDPGAPAGAAPAIDAFSGF